MSDELVARQAAEADAERMAFERDTYRAEADTLAIERDEARVAMDLADLSADRLTAQLAEATAAILKLGVELTDTQRKLRDKEQKLKDTETELAFTRQRAIERMNVLDRLTYILSEDDALGTPVERAEIVPAVEGLIERLTRAHDEIRRLKWSALPAAPPKPACCEYDPNGGPVCGLDASYSVSGSPDRIVVAPLQGGSK